MYARKARFYFVQGMIESRIVDRDGHRDTGTVCRYVEILLQFGVEDVSAVGVEFYTGNVGDPPGNLGAMIHGIRSGRYLSIAGSRTRKSVLMVQDIARLVPLLVEKGGIYNVCDSYQPTFRELEAVICRQLDRNLPLSIPYWMAKCMALMGDCFGKKAPVNSQKLSKITESLTFSNEKAVRELGWRPISVLENFKIG